MAHLDADDGARSDDDCRAAREAASASGPFWQDRPGSVGLFSLLLLVDCGTGVGRSRLGVPARRPMVGAPCWTCLCVPAAQARHRPLASASRCQWSLKMSLLARYLMKTILGYTFLVMLVLLV